MAACLVNMWAPLLVWQPSRLFNFAFMRPGTARRFGGHRLEGKGAVVLCDRRIQGMVAC